MNELYMMVTIVDRKKTKKFVDFYNESCGLHVAIITAGDGTAADELLDYFGTGGKEAEKFLGVTLVPEKEMVFIVARTERKNDIMKAIMESAGTNTKAGSIVFSLPVTDTAGMRLMEYVDDEEA